MTDRVLSPLDAPLGGGASAALTRLAGRRVVASVSGGKDSAALSLWLHEQGIDHDRVFLDTGWEHPATYDYLRNELPAAIGPIEWVRGELQMEELILSKGMFPSRLRRFCTQKLKVYPMQAHIAGLIADGHDIVNAVGIRAAESESRSRMPEWEWQEGFDCEVWRPLIRWSMQDVIDIHARHGLRPNPLYLLGATRVGCWPCIYARKSEIRLVADTDPGRIDRLRRIEDAVANNEGGSRSRYERDRAEWLANPPPEPPPEDEKAHAAWEATRRRLMEWAYMAPTFFQAQTKDSSGRYRMIPIDEAVEWARTSRGGGAVRDVQRSGGPGLHAVGTLRDRTAG